MVYYHANDDVLGGPQVIRYSNVAGYPVATEYAEEWAENPNAVANVDGAGAAAAIALLPVDQMVWGDGEVYRHNVYRRITRITPIIPGGIGRSLTNTYDDATGTVTTVLSDGTAITSP
jgi:hypothetical protein